MIRLLQVCNVGQILGGTAACAWTVTKSLPQFEHTVAFFSKPTPETEHAFNHCRVAHWKRVDHARVASVEPDVVILHNTARNRVEQPLPVACIQYLHSSISPAMADVTAYCSEWLAGRYDADVSRVCLQAVPRPERPEGFRERRSLREFPVIGRICTPTARKWPASTVSFYDRLASLSPQVRWEFVGCPASLQSELRQACHGNVEFLDASWQMRGRLWEWDCLLYHHPDVTESFGRTVAEAMRAGCIPIVDNRGGFREQIADGCGFLCENEGDFENSIRRVLSPACRWRMSRACRAYADQRFSLARFGRDLFELIGTAAKVANGDALVAGRA